MVHQHPWDVHTWTESLLDGEAEHVRMVPPLVVFPQQGEAWVGGVHGLVTGDES